MNKATSHRVISLVSFMAAALACWIVAGAVADRTAQHELDDAMRVEGQLSSATADAMVQIIASDLAMARAIPETLAQTRTIQHVLAQSRNYAVKRAGGESTRRAELLGNPELAATDAFLHDAQGFSGLDNLWLVNPNGLCIASSNARSAQSFVGLDLSTRGYLRNALLGSFGQAYGIGRKSAEAGIFFASPVYEDGMLVGAIVAKVGLGRLRHWVAAPGSFVADENGVVIMARDSALEGRRLPQARIMQLSAAQRMDGYQRDTFAVLDIEPLARRLEGNAPWVPPALAAQLFELPGTHVPSLYAARGGLNSGLSAHLVEPLVSWPELERHRRFIKWLAFALISGAALLAYVIAASYRREKRHHRAARRLAAQLRATNTLLSAEVREDVLTGALTRRYFLSLLRQGIETARARGEPLCLAIADLDHFKQINDRFGHTAGDRALEHFVALCRDELRGNDTIGRLGGEEFAILFTGTPLADSIRVAERLRERLKTHRSPHLPSEVLVSVSIGVTELSPADTLERLLSRADCALYVAKSAGRDRIEALPRDDTQTTPDDLQAVS
ncbi:sensor domain-containing diguanylate cyclase [Trinickia fusca]|uniref:diguanylate cyclase n=1 Tax=Trinickia fusca TaxID=2419777 RepID=A0A494X3E0_9BURK|nr:sensor domain-containing diguanylate cyclase [Trinickia fusca]RKP44882.1 sensor domain-containing diguanylate cyclase [Trinickia fusca]